MIRTTFQNLLSILVLIFLLSYSSCKKKDEAIPNISLKGAAIDTIILNEKLIDPGALANDSIDGDITPQIQSDYLNVINKDSVGLYTVTYKITDKAGNVNTIKRQVYVMNQAQIWEGSYNAIDSIFKIPIVSLADSFRKTYPVKIRASKFKNKEFLINGFGKFSATNYPTINIVAVAVDSNSIFTKANIPPSDQPLINVSYIPAITCTTSSHKIKSFQRFYLKTAVTPKKIFIEYEDEVYDPATCLALYRGKLYLTYTGGL